MDYKGVIIQGQEMQSNLRVRLRIILAAQASKTGPVELIHKSLVMSPLQYEADTNMGWFHLNPPVRSKYFNYQLWESQSSKFAFHAGLFQQFLLPLYNPPLSGLQECRKLPEIINGQRALGLVVGGSNLMIYHRSIHFSRPGEGTNSWTGGMMSQTEHFLFLPRPTLRVIFYNLSKISRNYYKCLNIAPIIY